jgi:hypothetical protein
VRQEAGSGEGSHISHVEEDELCMQRRDCNERLVESITPYQLLTRVNRRNAPIAPYAFPWGTPIDCSIRFN